MKTQALLGVVTITGLWTLSLCVTHQYHFVYDKLTWTDAQQYCMDKFTDLATVHTLEDVNTLNSMVDLNKIDHGGKGVWIGLYTDVNSWRWSLEDERFYNDAEEHTFRNWIRGEPDGDGACVIMSPRSGLFFDRSCAKSQPVICFNNTEPIRKYINVEKKLTWSEAQRECREKHTDLASVRNQAENQEIKKIMVSNVGYWIGLYRDSWKWSDGSNSSFRYWKRGQPNGGLRETCAAMVFALGSKWADWTCDYKASFICYSMKKPVLRVKLAINSSLDMNDPAVADAILEQLKQNIKDHQGAPADIKVRWVEQADGRIFHKEDKKKREKKIWERKPRLTKREL